jgi:hypothetical protein
MTPDSMAPMSAEEVDALQAKMAWSADDRVRIIKTARDRGRQRDAESPEAILMRCALELRCEPRHVYDRLLERLKDAAKAKQANRTEAPTDSTGQR